MSRDWWLAAGAVALALVAIVLLAAALVRLRSRTRREIEAARAEAASVRAELAELERRLSRSAVSVGEREYRITDLGQHAPDAEVEQVALDRQLFADLVLRESVVRAASFAHGVRRVLTPEARNRIRFEVRREVKRSRRQRRDDVREAVREWRARQRDDEPAAPLEETG